MASLAKPISFSFIVLVFFSIQIQARESKFFSKFTHLSTNDNVKVIKGLPTDQAPSPAPAPASVIAPTLAPVHSENENGYGLYGHGSGVSGQFNPTTSDEDEIVNEELNDVSYQKGYQNSNYNNNGYKLTGESYEPVYENNNFNNKGYTRNYNNNNNNNNGYKLTSENYETGGYENSQINNNGYYTNTNNNGYDQMERQGMSDTRFLENGKYYFDVKNENYYPSDGYGSERTQNQGYYGNGENTNEFNSMEEYDKYRESQEEYVP